MTEPKRCDLDEPSAYTLVPDYGQASSQSQSASPLKNDHAPNKTLGADTPSQTRHPLILMLWLTETQNKAPLHTYDA